MKKVWKIYITLAWMDGKITEKCNDKAEITLLLHVFLVSMCIRGFRGFPLTRSENFIGFVYLAVTTVVTKNK